MHLFDSYHLACAINCSLLPKCRFQSSRILVGLSATPYGDMALKQAVRMSRDGDTVIGIFVPPALDPNVFPPNALQAMKDRQAKQLKEIHDRAAKVSDFPVFQYILTSPDASPHFAAGGVGS